MFHVPNKYRVRKGDFASDDSYGNNGLFWVPFKNRRLKVIASDGDGWEHVSVSHYDRCPIWEEMCFIKDMFWDDTDTVVQFHPAKKDYVNFHPFCLHLWRQENIETPPYYLIGPK